jgi:chemosensory pili system protein ChpA (sensor histidine kinase/response regulator)
MSNLSDLDVLIVEDALDVAKMLQISLEQIGIDAVLAKNGQVALDYLDHTEPDLILLDLNLPKINGWQVLEYAKKLYGEHSIRVIVTTANTDEVNRLVGKMQYVSSYIQKPFTIDSIVDVVRGVLELDKF